MRLVVDTNVFVSAALKHESAPGNTLRWVAQYGGLLKTSATEREVMRVLQRPYFAPKIAPFFLENLRRVFAAAELVTITEHIIACRDPNDDKFLELAVNGHADVQLTLLKRLVKAGARQGNGRRRARRTTGSDNRGTRTV